MNMIKHNAPAERKKEGLSDPFLAPESAKVNPEQSLSSLKDLLRVKNERMEAMAKAIPDDPRAQEQFDVASLAVQKRRELLATITV